MPPEEKTKEEVVEEQTATEEQTTTEEVAAEETETATEKTYAELGIDARFDSMNREQFATEIKHRNSVHGRQASEVGKLRKDLAAAQERLSGFDKAAGQPVEVKEAVADMTDAELTRWLEDLQSNPRKAFKQILGDDFGRRSEDDVKKMVTELFNEYIGQYQGYTEEQAVMSDTDYQVHANYMDGLRKPEYFGNTRSAQELLAFAKFANGEEKPVVDALYDAMKRFPQVPMKDCLNMVKGRGGAVTEKKKVDPDDIRKQAERLEGGKLPSGSKKVSQNEKIVTMEDAFHGTDKTD